MDPEQSSHDQISARLSGDAVLLKVGRDPVAVPLGSGCPVPSPMPAASSSAGRA
jgi:hypothetical protein